MTNMNDKKIRRTPIAEALVPALIALRELRRAIQDGSFSKADVWADELGECLLSLEDRVGCITPTSLFDCQ